MVVHCYYCGKKLPNKQALRAHGRFCLVKNRDLYEEKLHELEEKRGK